MPSNPRNVSGGLIHPPDEPFQLTRKPAGVRFLNRGVQPPSAIYVEAEDDLAVSVASSQAAEVVTFNYRLLRFDGEVIEGQFTVSPPSNRTVTKYSESLAEGFLLSMSCQAKIATTRGQTFVRVALTSPAFGGNLPSYMLMADYVTTQMAPAHPNGRVLAPTEGPGWRRLVVATTPGAGVEWTVTTPANARWRVDAVRASYTIANAGAARIPGVSLSVGGSQAFIGAAEATLPINSVANVAYSKVPNKPAAGTSLAWVALPIDLVMLAGDVITSSTVALNGADQYTGINLAVEEWLDNV